MEYQKEKSNFLTETYLDLSRYYERAKNEKVPFWDYVVLTASNKEQEKSYEQEIDYRLKRKLIPPSHYLVIPDPEGKRVGSGGATLHLLKIIKEQSGENFKNLKILVIHSGGDSKRIPQYSSCGKIFSPVQRELLPTGGTSTLFDEFLITFAPVYSRVSPGVMLLSGDVTLVFNPMQVDLHHVDAGAISIKESAATATNHGVFLTDKDGLLRHFLHKKSYDTLKDMGAINSNGNVDIDTGAVFLSSQVSEDLLSLIDDPSQEKVYINDITRLSLYADLVFPFSANATLKDFQKEEPEGDFSDSLTGCREELWNILHGKNFKVVKTSPSSFIHFGTTKELSEKIIKNISNYQEFMWTRNVFTNVQEQDNYCVNSSIINNSKIGDNAYIEYSNINNCVVGESSIVSGIDAHDMTFPSNACFHAEMTDGGYIVRLYGLSDNPKTPDSFLMTSLPKIINHYTLEDSCFWDGQEKNLWQAKLYTEAPTMEEALDDSLLLYRIAAFEASEDEVKSYLRKPRYSLLDSFKKTNHSKIIARRDDIDCRIRSEKLLATIKNKRPLSSIQNILKNTPDIAKQEKILVSLADAGDNYTAPRIYLALSYLFASLDCEKSENYKTKCFLLIGDSIISAGSEQIEKSKIKDFSSISLPVRANLAGGWSDTPPYCTENGGRVVNIALTLEDKLPITATIEKTKENTITLSSVDLNIKKSFDNIAELKTCRDTDDPFSLLKATLLVSGIVSMDDRDVSDVLTRIGSGFCLTTDASFIPKGSGLGTSSILAGSCLMAIYDFLGIKKSEVEICQKTLETEQLMGTGGGWQDQIGGIIPGVKIISTKRGPQKFSVEKLKLSPKMQEFFDNRYVLIYTGQRRLAKNLLFSIIEKYIANDPQVVGTIDTIKSLSRPLADSILSEDIGEFCHIINRHWELSQRLDDDFTNTPINHIIKSCEDLIDAKMMCGAGGGGFLQIVLKEGVSKSSIEKRINTIFEDCGVRVYKTSIWDK